MEEPFHHLVVLLHQEKDFIAAMLIMGPNSSLLSCIFT